MYNDIWHDEVQATFKFMYQNIIRNAVAVLEQRCVVIQKQDVMYEFTVVIPALHYNPI